MWKELDFVENLPPVGVLSQLLSEKFNFATNGYLASTFSLARPRPNSILHLRARPIDMRVMWV